MDLIYEDGESTKAESLPRRILERPSPSPEAALRSAKLAALHARLSLPKRLPLQTMARTLVDPSADSNADFNNEALARLGGSIIVYHVSEFLLCTYPRLPMTVLFSATLAYNGPKTLQMIAREWGVEAAAAPGSEVDPGYLQYEKVAPGTNLNRDTGGGMTRPDAFSFYKRGISSRIVYDDEFGDVIPRPRSGEDEADAVPQTAELAFSSFVKAVVGAVYLHSGREAAKDFVRQHILSRYLDLSSLFQFKSPLRELSKLCLRENFEYPVARMLSETGRHSRTPVFVVGIFSGKDKLGEGSGPNLSEARLRASVAALKAWYLYSPGRNVRVPSEMEGADGKEKSWEPVHIDIGEIIF